MNNIIKDIDPSLYYTKKEFNDKNYITATDMHVLIDMIIGDTMEILEAVLRGE